MMCKRSRRSRASLYNNSEVGILRNGFFWLVVEPTHLRWNKQNISQNGNSHLGIKILFHQNISQNRNLPQIGVKINNIWNHHLGFFCRPSNATNSLDLQLFRCNFRKKVQLANSPKNYWRTIRFFGVSWVQENLYRFAWGGWKKFQQIILPNDPWKRVKSNPIGSQSVKKSP